jgi:hypothetical protein
MAAKLKIEKRGDEIEQFWQFEEISIFSNGGHLGYRTALTDTILKGAHPGTIPARFGLICFSISQNELKFEQQLHGKE